MAACGFPSISNPAQDLSTSAHRSVNIRSTVPFVHEWRWPRSGGGGPDSASSQSRRRPPRRWRRSLGRVGTDQASLGGDAPARTSIKICRPPPLVSSSSKCPVASRVHDRGHREPRGPWHMGPGPDPERCVALETLMVPPMTTLVELDVLPSSGLGPIENTANAITLRRGWECWGP